MSSSRANLIAMAGVASTTPLSKIRAVNVYRRYWAQIRTSFFWMVVISFALRLGYMMIAHSYRFKAIGDNFSFGFEMGRIGRSLATGGGFGNPFNGYTGPTAWEPPLYALLIAGVFQRFGIYSQASAFILLTLNSIFSALTCILIFLIAKRCFGERVAVWSAWAWALLPSVMYWSTRWVWETSLAALLLAVLFWLTLVMEEREGLKPWLTFAVIWGIAALTNPSLLAFLPASGLWIWYQRWKVGKRSLAGIVLASAVFLGCIAPWLIRNYRTFGQVVFLRSNFGAELRIGNGPGANGTWMEYLHPTQNVYEMERYRRMGEMAYVKERKREAIDFIRHDYGRFIGLSLKRFIYYWGGVPRQENLAWVAPMKNALFLLSSAVAFWGLARALRRHRPGAWLFFWLILCYPAVYYFVFPHPRYRHPIEPELLILMVYVISEAERKQHRLGSISS